MFNLVCAEGSKVRLPYSGSSLLTVEQLSTQQQLAMSLWHLSNLATAQESTRHPS